MDLKQITLKKPAGARPDSVALTGPVAELFDALSDALEEGPPQDPSPAERRRVVERLSSLRDRPRLLDAFDAVSDDIRERRITTTFFPEKLEHDLDGLRVVVTGTLATFIETQRVSRAPRLITLVFVEEASSVRLASMTVEEASS